MSHDLTFSRACIQFTLTCAVMAMIWIRIFYAHITIEHSWYGKGSALFVSLYELYVLAILLFGFVSGVQYSRSLYSEKQQMPTISEMQQLLSSDSQEEDQYIRHQDDVV